MPDLSISRFAINMGVPITTVRRAVKALKLQKTQPNGKPKLLSEKEQQALKEYLSERIQIEYEVVEAEVVNPDTETTTIVPIQPMKFSIRESDPMLDVAVDESIAGMVEALAGLENLGIAMIQQAEENGRSIAKQVIQRQNLAFKDELQKATKKTKETGVDA